MDQWLRHKTADETQTEGQSHHLLFTKVNNARDIIENPHFRERKFFPVLTQEDFERKANLPSEGFYQYLDHEHVRRYPGAAARLDGQELPIRYPPPLLGEHNQEVYCTLLELSAGEVAQLQEQGVI